MTPDEIRSIILANADLKAYAAIGDDNSIAKMIGDFLPRIATGELITERSLFAELGPVVADTIMTKLEAFAQSGMPGSSLMNRGLRWLTPQAGGVDFQNADVLAMLNGLVATNVLSQNEFDLLSKLGTRKATISEAQIADILRPLRPNGTLVPLP